MSLLLLLACSGETEPVPEPTPQAPAISEIDRLRALGYLDAAEVDEGEASGLIHIDEARSQPGYNLFLTRNLHRADLIDAQGQLVHTWTHGDEGAWTRVRLLEDGSLLVVGSSQDPRKNNTHVDEARFVMKLSWEGELLWRARLNAHHDVVPLADGQFLALDFVYREIPALGPGTFRDDHLTWIDAEGVVQRSISLTQAIVDSPDQHQLRRVAPNSANGREHVDLLHANALFPTAEGQLLMTSRHQDLVFLLDLDTSELSWAWGPGTIQGPHDPSLLDNGHVLLFDNGLGRKWSRAIELDPATGEIVWEYKAAPPEDFYSRSRGSVQRLDNGNTLIAESDKGRAFEVTPEGEVVWEFRNPNFLGGGKRGTINRMERLPVGLVEPLLKP